MIRQAVVDALLEDGWELAKTHPRIVLCRPDWVVIIRRGGVVFVDDQHEHRQVATAAFRSWATDDDVIAYVRRVCTGETAVVTPPAYRQTL
jgi:hypothetical protein